MDRSHDYDRTLLSDPPAPGRAGRAAVLTGCALPAFSSLKPCRSAYSKRLCHKSGAAIYGGESGVASEPIPTPARIVVAASSARASAVAPGVTHLEVSAVSNGPGILAIMLLRRMR